MLDYQAFNKQVFSKVPVDAINILDVGCGTGNMGKALLEQNPKRVITGITYSISEGKTASLFYKQVHVHDLNDLSLELKEQFDCILFSHVLEHTYMPDEVLKYYCKYLSPNGCIIVALPNVLFFKQRYQFLKGNFKYDPNGGFMDTTHFRFFDFETAKDLVANAGLHLISAEGFGKFPLPLIRKYFSSFAESIDRKACRIYPGLFSFQYVLVARI